MFMLLSAWDDTLQSIRFASVIFQERIEKASDIRVLGSELFVTETHSQANSSTNDGSHKRKNAAESV